MVIVYNLQLLICLGLLLCARLTHLLSTLLLIGQIDRRSVFLQTRSSFIFPLCVILGLLLGVIEGSLI